MAKLRKFVSYRNLKRPYTRKSKFTKKNFVRVAPTLRIQRFEAGNPNKKFEYMVLIRPGKRLQIRDNAIEAARQASNRLLSKHMTKDDFYFKTRVYPHHILRENPLASGAGADRMSTGMARSFGKNIGIAAQVNEKKPLFQISINKQNLKYAKQAMRLASTKMPCKCYIDIFDSVTKKRVFV
jgi:large subunit ribosomal protein L10e